MMKSVHRWTRFLVVLMIIGALAILSSMIAAREGARPVYPEAINGNVVDDYHGMKIPDPYRWLEDPDSPETRAWIEAQNRLTFGYLEQIPERQQIKERLTALWDYEKYGLPYRYGNRYFFTKNDGLQNQSVLYTVTSLDDDPALLLDPNGFSEDGTVALSGWSPTDDGGLMAYGLSTAGSDWEEWFVRDVGTGQDLDDHIKWMKFSSASWTKDNRGFFYSRYDEPAAESTYQEANYYQKLYYHRLGTSQAEDILVYERPDQKEWEFGGYVTDDGRYLVITVWKGTERNNLVFYKDLQEDNSPVVELVNTFDAGYSFLDNDGTIFWFKTDLAAPRGRVIAIDIRQPERGQWKEAIPEAEETLENVSIIGNMFVTSYLKDAHSDVRIFDLTGQFVRTLGLPGIGSVDGFSGKRSDTETFYSYSSFLDPGTIYRYDIATGEARIFRRPQVDLKPEEFETKQIFYTGKDGTRVPMFISHKKGISLNGENPTILYGYGGFNIAMTPYFSISRLVWMEMGGVHAVACVRGGGEYGKEWHEAGMKLKKQNCFDDFIAAAEWLVGNKYTSTAMLAISGGSNGGTLVGACMNQRPDLFGACLPAVGVMDMLRFHKFTIGWGWVSDYGSPDDPEEFKALYAYSPLHNIKPGTSYPATLITTADHDDRVVPAHSFKFAAALQAAQAGDAPVFIRIETKAGHGAGKPTTMRIEESTDVMAFLVRVFDMNIR